MKRRLLVGLLVLLSACSGPKESLDLVELFETASRGPVLAPQGELGRPPAAAFLLGPWEQSQAKAERVLGEGEGALRFYCQEAVPLTLELEGRALEEVSGQLSFNGTDLGPLTLKPGFGISSWEVNAEDVRPGENRLGLNFPVATAWRTLRVKVRGAAQPLAAEHQVRSFATAGEVGTLSLPYGSSLSYPLSLPNHSTLVLDQVQAWADPGAAAHPKVPALQVRLRCDSPEFEQRWTLEGKGPHRLSLPLKSEGSAAVALTLSLPPQETPVPGQLGVSLHNPRVETPAEPKETPQRSPSSPAPAPLTAPSTYPNVVVYLVDTLRADRLSTYGYARPTSPHLEALAKDGIVFEQVLAESPWTKPSTATLLSGLPARAHATHDFGDKLPQSVETLPELLQKAGYQTAGFFSNPLASPLFDFHQGMEVHRFERRRTADKINEWVFPWLDQLHPRKPFFLYVHTIDPHLPYTPPPPFNTQWCPQQPQGVDNDQVQEMARFAEAHATLNGDGPEPPGLQELKDCYDGEVAANDAAFGALIEELKTRQLYDNTLIVFVSDHGEELFDHRGFGHVHSMYPELLGVPWVMKLPQQKGAGTRVKTLWTHMDTVPTIIAHCGLPVPAEMPGRVFHQNRAQGPSPPAVAYVHTGRDAVATQQHGHPFLLHAESVRMGRFQLTRTHAQLLNRLPPLALFDLVEDPQQRRNLAQEYPATVLHLSRWLDRVASEQDKGRRAERVAPELLEADLRSLQYLR